MRNISCADTQTKTRVSFISRLMHCNQSLSPSCNTLTKVLHVLLSTLHYACTAIFQKLQKPFPCFRCCVILPAVLAFSVIVSPLRPPRDPRGEITIVVDNITDRSMTVRFVHPSYQNANLPPPSSLWFIQIDESEDWQGGKNVYRTPPSHWTCCRH